MKVGEMVTDYIARVMVVTTDIRNCGEDMMNAKIVEKIMQTLTEFDYIVCSIEEAYDIDKIMVDALQNSLLIHEQKLLQRKGGDEQALKITYDETTSGKGRGRERGRVSGAIRGRGQSRFFNKETIEFFNFH